MVEAERASHDIWDLMMAYQVSQAIHVAASLRIADLLNGGPRDVSDLAECTGADTTALYRLLRALAAKGIFDECNPRVFQQSKMSEMLRSDDPNSFVNLATYIGRPYVWYAWGHLLYSVRTGQNAFRHVWDEDVWTYRSKDPTEDRIFELAMTPPNSHFVSMLARAVDVPAGATVVDIGGGNGALLRMILEMNTTASGVLLERASVIQQLREESRPAELDRLQLVAGDFFQDIPSTGDIYILKSILHDWGDSEAIAILQAVRKAMKNRAIIHVIERVLAGPNLGADQKFSDLNMLVSPGGRERDMQEFAELAKSANLRILGSVDTGATFQRIDIGRAEGTDS